MGERRQVNPAAIPLMVDFDLPWPVLDANDSHPGIISPSANLSPRDVQEARRAILFVQEPWYRSKTACGSGFNLHSYWKPWRGFRLRARVGRVGSSRFALVVEAVTASTPLTLLRCETRARTLRDASRVADDFVNRLLVSVWQSAPMGGA